MNVVTLVKRTMPRDGNSFDQVFACAFASQKVRSVTSVRSVADRIDHVVEESRIQ